MGLGVWVAGRLVAFTLSELLPSPYAAVLFIKSDTTCSGVQDFIFRETARHLLHVHGRTVLNLEEDGGSEGLRRYKSGLRPFAYIRKYMVQHRHVAQASELSGTASKSDWAQAKQAGQSKLEFPA